MKLSSSPERAWYEKKINTLNEVKHLLIRQMATNKLYYRGMSQYEFNCVSTYYRFYCSVNNLNWKTNNICFNTQINLPDIDSEEYLKKSFEILDDFSGNLKELGAQSISNNSLLYLAQHYGIPTNLIDFSHDPKIALYFACCNDFYDNGTVYESYIYEHVDHFYQFLKPQHCKHYVCNDDGELMSDAERMEVAIRLKTKIKRDKPDLITPIIKNGEVAFNLRIKNQKGAFVYNPTPYPYDIIMYCASSTTHHYGRQVYVINKDIKQSILKLLDDDYGINESYVYPSNRIDINKDIILKAAELTKEYIETLSETSPA